MLDQFTGPIAIAMVIYLIFYALIFLLGKVLSNQMLIRYVDMGMREFIIILVFVILTYISYRFIYFETIQHPDFVLSAFQGSSIAVSPGSFLTQGTIYNISRQYLLYMLGLINNMSYMLIETEARMYHYSSFTCSRCASDITIGGFDAGCFFFPNSLSLYTVIPYTNYIEPIAQSLAAARNSLELSTKILGSYYGLLNLSSTRSIVLLLAYGIILRLIPGMKFAGNTLMAIAFVMLIILPVIIYLQSNIFFKYINNDVMGYYDRIKNFSDNLPGYLEPNILSQLVININNLFVDPTDPCKNIVSTPYINKKGTDIEFGIPTSGNLFSAIFGRPSTTILDSEIKRAYQSQFIISTFSLSSTIVAMIIAAKSIVILLGERFSFLDLFLRVI